MEQYILAFLSLFMIGGAINSIKVINENEKALVSCFGKYHRSLKPGINFIVPVWEKIECVESLQERVLDIDPQKINTLESIEVRIDGVVFWQILDLKKAYYEIENISEAINLLVLSTLRSEFGRWTIQKILSTKDEIEKNILKTLDDSTNAWGIKILRVKIKEITLPPKLLAAMEDEKAAHSQKVAAITKAEGEKQASIARAEGEAKAIKEMATALGVKPDDPQFLKFLIAQQYVAANQKISESKNTKVIFMDPKGLTESVAHLMEDIDQVNQSHSQQDVMPSTRNIPNLDKVDLGN
jgi:regulator of protease activity HflC (stomatin/prohibitin superfamily)